MPAFVVALFFRPWERREEERMRRQARVTETETQLIQQLTRVSVGVRKVKVRLQSDPLLRPGSHVLLKLVSLLDAVRQQVAGPRPAAVRLSDVEDLRQLVSPLADSLQGMSHLRDAIDELDEPLETVGALAGPSVEPALEEVEVAIERMRYAIPHTYLRDEKLLRRFTDEDQGTWDGKWVELPGGGGFAVSLAAMQDIVAAARDRESTGEALARSLEDLSREVHKLLAPA